MVSATTTKRSKSPTSALTTPAQEAGAFLVATDASTSSDAAVRAAHAIAARTGGRPMVVAVHQPMPVMAPEVQIATTPKIDAERRQALRASVKVQLERLGISSDWQLEVLSGYPGVTIANLAKTTGAQFIVMGLGGHGLFERVFGDEMTLQVLKVGAVPVLAVAESFDRLPSRVLAAVDFSASSGRALAMAAPLVSPGGRITLAHVIPVDRDPVAWSALDAAYVGSVGRALDRIIAEAGVPDDVTCDRRILSGEPASELLQLAEATGADLLVAGSHGHNFLSRLLLGSVSTKLLRNGGRSIMVAPPVAAPGYLDELSEDRGRFAFYEWAERLEEFTRRNAGRGARLEVIDPEIGAQVEENHVPFIGASFDPRDGKVQLMFAAPDGGGHLTRGIADVSAIQMLRDRNGQDALLRVAHGRGQTLLTLER